MILNRKRMIIAFYGDSLTEGKTGISYFDIINKNFPGDTFLNYGKGGDTPISLYHRLLKQGLPKSSDIAFLWVGVNDILAKTSWFFAARRRFFRKPWAKDVNEFKEHYRNLLDLLAPSAERLFTIPPLFIGEDMRDSWNQKLGMIGKLIEDMTTEYENAKFIDIRQEYIRLSPKNVRSYSSKKLIPLIAQNLFPRYGKKGTKISSGKGYHFTCDGIHLSQRGAEIAAKIISEEIRIVKSWPRKK